MEDYYNWFKALHVIAIICWMAGMLYLPRIFVYHSNVAKGGDADNNFKIMEAKLLKFIINPAMILSTLFGSINVYIYGLKNMGIWFHIKMSAVFFLMLLHGMSVKWHKQFLKGQNTHSHIFFRWINEGVTFFMVICIIMVVVKPFE
jgi:putative membrane protein